MSECCIQGFEWEGTPTGRETTLAGNKTYITGSDNSDVAIIIIHDLFGWTFPNLRLLADHYAREVNATVYLPDFFGGEVLPAEILRDNSQWSKLDIPAFTSRNTKEIREAEIVECTRALRTQYGHKRVGAIGFCFGGWAVFRLGSKAHNNVSGQETKLVDCISTAHPTWLTKEEIENVGVPVQILAPEFDPVYTPELKEFSNKVIPTLGVPYDYQYFPGVAHAFAVRGDPGKDGERKGMVRAKNAAAYWMREWLHVQ